MNRLADEPSPYLRQHADNPVAWWPWCDEAFAEARRRDVPVFLSIGYATCHWCHVMAHESFEDADVAAAMNDAFVCIKVDREERPDLDDAYMAVCQTMTGSGGWPLTVLLTPERRPWFAGTYFPKTTRGQRLGMLELVPRLAQAWRDQRKELEHSAGHVLEHLRAADAGPATADGDAPEPSPAWLDAAQERLASRFDPEHGGFGRAPKFPSPHQVRFLLRRHHRGDPDALGMATATLDAMIAGGLQDHVGGGFHRYSTDRTWLLPHFEKMLYDQAGMLLALTEAYQVTREDRYRDAAVGIVEYVLRDLRDPGGAFWSAEDADSESVEGKFYVWGHDEVHAVLEGDAAAFCEVFSVRPGGNHHDEATGQPAATNILHVKPGTDTRPWRGALERLREARNRRVRPSTDDKVLTDWNGLFLGALARAGSAFEEPGWVQTAQDAAGFLERHLRTKEGGLRHRYRDGVVDDHAFRDDHAYLLGGLVDLVEATGSPRWLRWARRVADDLLAGFTDDDGALLTAPVGSDVVLNRRDAYDGAMPSGNSAAVEGLWRLGRLLGEPGYEEAAWRIVQAFGTTIERMPEGFTAMLCGLDAMLDGGQEVVIVGDGADAMLRTVHAAFRPGTLVVPLLDAGLAEEAAWLEGHTARDGKVTAYVCVDHACKAPVTTLEDLEKALA